MDGLSNAFSVLELDADDSQVKTPAAASSSSSSSSSCKSGFVNTQQKYEHSVICSVQGVVVFFTTVVLMKTKIFNKKVDLQMQFSPFMT